MKFFSLILIALFVSQAHADDISKPDCKQPVVPLVQASDLVVKYFYKHMAEYTSCIKKFVDEQGDIAKKSTDVTKANLAHDAAESAIKEFNDFMEVAKSRNDKIQEGEDAK